MRELYPYFLAWGTAYLLGSLPPGLLWSWLAKRIDVRQHGSGRTGGTNVWRNAGFWPALLTALCDALKGAAGIWVARALGLGPWGTALTGMWGVVGHNYSLFLRFTGGAGTMISVGIAATLWTAGLPLLVVVGVSAGLLVGHASVASTVVALLLPTLFALRGDLANAVGFGLPTMLLTLWALRPNLRRLAEGRERFLPLYREKAPPITISRHPKRQRDQPTERPPTSERNRRSERRSCCTPRWWRRQYARPKTAISSAGSPQCTQRPSPPG
ncbi:MAG: glycerol-3-phosphate acyltransferase [Anaerolineae bacterium]